MAIAAREYQQNPHQLTDHQRRELLDRCAAGERAALVARDLGVSDATAHYWIAKARREWLATAGSRLAADRADLEGAAAEVQRLLDAAGLPLPEKRALQNAVVYLVAQAMRRE